MNESTIDKVVQRLDRLEKENRWMKHLGIVLIIGMAALVVMGQSSPRSRIIEAESFVATDSEGNVRVVLGGVLPMEYAPSLSRLKEIPNFLNHGLLVYAGGKTIIRLTEELGGGGLLELNDKKTASSVKLNSFPGIVSLTMKATDRDREEAHRELIDRLTGRGGKRLAKPTSKNNWISATATAKWTQLSIQQKGKFRAVLGDFEFKKARTGVVEKRPASSLVLLDENGKVTWKAP